MNLIKTAIIDTGLDSKCNYLHNVPCSGVAIKYNGKFEYDCNYEDDNGHGTACASMIYKECKNIEFIVVKIMDKNGKTNLLVVEEALRYLGHTEAKIINMSFSMQQPFDDELYQLCDELTRNGKILIASCENNNKESFPSSYSNVIGVRGAELKNFNEMWFDSNKKIQCIIDNTPAMSAALNNKYQLKSSNNSLATAKVTGIVAALISKEKKDVCLQDFNSISNELMKYSSNCFWSEDELIGHRKVNNKEEWYIDNDDLLLQRIYHELSIKLIFEKSSDNLCDLELLTSNGVLSFDDTFDIVEHISNKLNISIDYMDLNRYDLLTIGTLTKFFRRYNKKNEK